MRLTIWFASGRGCRRRVCPSPGSTTPTTRSPQRRSASALGSNRTLIEQGLHSFTAGFGRQERMQIAGRDVQVMLAKNPAGLNQVLRTITSQRRADRTSPCS